MATAFVTVASKSAHGLDERGRECRWSVQFPVVSILGIGLVTSSENPGTVHRHPASHPRMHRRIDVPTHR